MKNKVVYTINNKTNTIDEWLKVGALRTQKELLIQLVRGKQTCFLPARCVFESKDEAMKVINKK